MKKDKALDKQEGGSHYKHFQIQPIEFCEKNNLTACESNVVKYVCRHRFKNGREDILKAIHYLYIILELYYNEDDKDKTSEKLLELNNTQIPEPPKPPAPRFFKQGVGPVDEHGHKL